jgi:hypothetical protein
MLTERRIIEQLQIKLKPKFNNIWIHKKISSSNKFKDYIEKELGYIPILQPEFDMVFETFEGNLNAIEVKYLNKKNNGYNIPYYFGIGQALALQRFGFDHVGLWLIVGDDVDTKKLHTYGSEAWSYIRDEIDLKIEYTYIQLSTDISGSRFKVMKFDGPHKGIELLDIDDKYFKITWKRKNPLVNHEKSIKLRKGIDLYLRNKL